MSEGYLVIDIDNVVARSDEVMREIIKEYSQDKVNLRYEDVKQFKYEKCVDRKGNILRDGEWDLIHEEFSKEDNILRIQPYPDIQKHLLRLIDAGYQIHLVTSRLRQARIPTIAWIDRHNIPHDGIHFVQHRCKHLIFQNCVGVIEDDLDQGHEFALFGIPVYILSHPWNELDGSMNIVRLQTWDEIVDNLLKI